AKRAGMGYVTNRWLNGMLTNYQTVKTSINRMKKIEALKESTEWAHTSKKEQSRYERELDKLKKSLGGIQDMKKLPGALFIVDTMKEHIAVKEAKKLGIPIVAVVDTNCDPSEVNYVIPGNDDAIRSVSLFARLIADSCLEGDKVFQEKLRANQVDANQDDSDQEKKVSKFEGDIDLKGIDEADLEAMSAAEATEGEAPEAGAEAAAAPTDAAAPAKAPAKKKK
ncbi:MAG: 30S ribosomal protein S2, partial [Bacteriovoracia bacterium]